MLTHRDKGCTQNHIKRAISLKSGNDLRRYNTLAQKMGEGRPLSPTCETNLDAWFTQKEGAISKPR